MECSNKISKLGFDYFLEIALNEVSKKNYHSGRLTDTMKSISLPKLHHAVKKNNQDLVAQLIAQGQNVDAQTKVII